MTRVPNSTRLSSFTSTTTVVAVGVASAPDSRREDEVCAVNVYEVCAVMTVDP